MGIRSFLSKPLAAFVANQQRDWSSQPAETQQKVFKSIIGKAKNTVFGIDHDFEGIRSHKDYAERVPIRDYEALSPYIKMILDGKKDILWPGKPVYFAKTSGTTSGTKYIPLTKDSIPNHINSARNAILSYIHQTGKAQFIDGKLIFLSGSPVLDKKSGIYTGRLSGIVNHHVPGYLRTNQMPSYETNCIDDWEDKLERIIDETIHQKMSLISGIPPWVQMYFDRIIERTGKSIKDVFPDFSMFIYGGVNFEPYRAKLFESIGKKIDSIETYPASEGFIAYQDSQTDEGLLLLLKSGIFFEFVPTGEYFNEKPTRLTIEEVELGVNYAVIINSNAGLWGYSIGEEVEKAMKHATEVFKNVEIIEFTVAPQVTPERGLPLHEWYVEFSKGPEDMDKFEKVIDEKLQQLNSYYEDLITGKILRPLKIFPLQKDAFRKYMKLKGKLGGQNKVPRLSNDRQIADELRSYQ